MPDFGIRYETKDEWSPSTTAPPMNRDRLGTLPERYPDRMNGSFQYKMRPE